MSRGAKINYVEERIRGILRNTLSSKIRIEHNLVLRSIKIFNLVFCFFGRGATGGNSAHSLAALILNCCSCTGVSAKTFAFHWLQQDGKELLASTGWDLVGGGSPPPSADAGAPPLAFFTDATESLTFVNDPFIFLEFPAKAEGYGNGLSFCRRLDLRGCCPMPGEILSK